MAETVLLTTQDLRLAGQLRTGFKDAGYRVEFLTSGEDPGGVEEPVLLILTSRQGGPEEEALIQAARNDLQVPVFAVLRPSQTEPVNGSAGELTRGLTGVFPGPPDPDEILLVGRTAIERNRLQRVTGIVGETDAMREVLERVVQIAPVGATVLVTGESGTGKELVARGIHALSRRRHRAFIAVNVAALSDTLLESELFGHEKGAFTGAVDARKGLFELADQGTIFLDEVGEMPLQTQTKLLRVLEQQEFLRVGGQKAIHVDVRIIAATNRRLRESVDAGDFRKDLYYRLNVLNIHLPPLRARRDDIARLVHSFIQDASVRYDREFLGISDDAMEILVGHRWPGNVRELRNLIESMVVLAPGRVIGADDIPDEVRYGSRTGALVPVTSHPSPDGGGDPALLRPQLEFLFRSMMDLKVDMDDLRREFEAFTRASGQVSPSGGSQDSLGGPGLLSPPSGGRSGHSLSGHEPELGTEVEQPSRAAGGYFSGPVEPKVIYEAGMTMEDMERQAIQLVLEEVGGNRRRAAEALEIGERTLYRKIKKFGLED
ncbi:MAG: sigma-54 interaction domain-containing protein [Longimicrobiales bacterium]